MIKDLKAREILDSRGNPTLEVVLSTKEGVFVSSVPAGASRGQHEAKELRDGGERYGGKGVLRAVKNVNEKIKPFLVGKKVDPSVLDKELLKMDGTSDKSNLGANALLGVSMSVFRAAAAEKNIPLHRYLSEEFSFQESIPNPCFNVINGGVHSGGGVSFQEFMIVPQKESFTENVRFAVEFSEKLRKLILENYGPESTNIGDEGGFVPDIKTEKEVLSFLNKVEKVPLIIDVAATEFFGDGKYFLNNEEKSTEEMIDFYRELSEEFSFLGIEDPLEENDFLGWKKLKEELKSTMIIGDDLLVTNTKRMEEAKENGSCNAMILKINQIGSITEAVLAAKKAKEFGWKIIVSHRSGETNDSFIADFAVGIGAEYIKSGAPKRGERVSKYNRLMEIENYNK